MDAAGCFRLECDALRLAVRALSELATGPARSKDSLLTELLPALCALFGAESGIVAERASAARREPGLRVIAAFGSCSESVAHGSALDPSSWPLARAIETQAPAEAPASPEAPARLALALCAQREPLGALLLEKREGAFDLAACTALQSFSEACGALLLGYERAARRARAEEDLVRSQRHLRRGAKLDGLTSLASRASSEAALRDAVARSHAAGLPLALIVLDLDHAKALADRIGAADFDEAVTAAARAIHATVRPSDWTGRWSVDAFVVTLLGCDAESAGIVAERIRLRAEGAAVRLWSGEELTLTVSAGVASTGPAAEDAAGLLARAQRALEEAKRAGRNRVCVSRPARA